MDFETASGAVGSIEIREGADSWGPFELDFTNGLPSGAVVSQATVDAYVGKVTKKDDLSEATEIATLVESTISVLGAVVGFSLQHPGTSYKNSKATLVITIETTDGGVFPYFFYPVNIF